MSFPRLFFTLLFFTAALLRADSVDTFDRAALLKTLTTDLSAHYAVTDTLEVDLLRPWTAPAIPASTQADKTGEPPVVTTVVDYPEALASSMLVRVRYTRDTVILREETLAVRANVWREGLTAATPVKRGAAVVLEGLETRRVDVLRERDSLPLSVAGADYVFSRDVAAGRPLMWRDVIRRSLVHRGQMVEVVASDGTLVITMKALAMQDGSHGDAVRVRNIESKREFTAKVIAENRAEVRF
ncbi:flagellar basal body P-ring formation chaperone FlgA [Rariglobus hedericola]|uniref:Flagella basal body P-ring formation protein FlgA n=1 Tax=Rariglobus hedericola TaxID=2597822 RepID=A0A556QPW0_9BACT|nr:flagellar basal body P-ring formation chaperone FlgA [Rariglobus hedericola]TSJ78632.1 flagellar basal body P-ring formation protein FlgA [Rariglobus hedericola]